MSRDKSFISSLFVPLASLLILFVTVFSTLWIWEKVSLFHDEVEIIREQYLAEKRTHLEKEVNHVVDYINFVKSQTETDLKREIKARTYEAYAIAMHIYMENRDKLADATIKRLIHDALYAASWDDGNGYYFAEDMQGTELINRNNPELEGTNVMQFRDSKGSFIMQEFLKVIRERGEGYATYYYSRPGDPDTFLPKISYLKRFEPYDWILGNGKYLGDQVEKVQKRVLERIGKVRPDGDNYIFVGTWDGVSLAKPFTGKNMLQVTDPNGVKIVQELIEVSKQPGGGYINYVMPKAEGVRPSPKLSYAVAIPDWRWYVGMGVYIDEIETVVADRQAQFKGELTAIVTKAIGLFLALLSVSLLLVWGYLRKIKSDLSVFRSFFKLAASGESGIELDQLQYVEFKDLAQNANEMISLRQQAIDELLDSEARFLSLVEMAPIPIVILMPDGTVDFVNQRFTELFGYRIADIPNTEQWMTKAFPDPNYREEIMESWTGAFASSRASEQSSSSETYQVRTAKGATLAVRFSYAHIGDRGMLIAYDLTEMIRAENERRRLEQKLHRSQKIEAIGLMAGSVAHDLNNILAGVVSYPEIMLRRLPEDSPLQPLLKKTKASGLRAADVVSDLLTVTRGVASEKHVIDLIDAIREYADSPEFHKSAARFPEVVISFSLPDQQIPIECSVLHVKKSLMNLVTNAVEAVEPAGQVEVTAGIETLAACCIGQQELKEGDYAVVRVANDGPPIPEEDLAHIFEPFYTRKEMGISGTGLGLAIVWNTMLDHYGAVHVSSTPEKTSFELFFPLSEAAPVSTAAENQPAVATGAGQRIMVVDDEAVQRDIADEMLSTLGYEVITADSGEQAIELLREVQVDLLILDMLMSPGIGGRETYEQVVQIAPRLKTLIVSGYTDSEDILHIQKMGAGDYLKKPYTFAQLERAVAKTLEA